MKDEYRKYYQESRRDKKQDVNSKKERKQYLRRKVAAVFLLGTCFAIVLLAVIFSFAHFYGQMKGEKESVVQEDVYVEVEPIVGAQALFPDLNISEQFLTINPYSRPGLALSTQPQYIVVHYTANPGSTAQQNHDYFEGLKDSMQTYASSQFVIGLDGEIIQNVPCNEMAYCSNQLNDVSISIEMCHPDAEGNFEDATYNSCVYLVAHLMNYYHLDMDHLIRHYDVTGKNCPKYFVEHEDRWEVFKGFVEEYREKYKNE